MELRAIHNRNDKWQWVVTDGACEYRSYRQYRTENAALKAGKKLLRKLGPLIRDANQSSVSVMAFTAKFATSPALMATAVKEAQKRRFPPEAAS